MTAMSCIHFVVCVKQLGQIAHFPKYTYMKGKRLSLIKISGDYLYILLALIALVQWFSKWILGTLWVALGKPPTFFYCLLMPWTPEFNSIFLYLSHYQDKKMIRVNLPPLILISKSTAVNLLKPFFWG